MLRIILKICMYIKIENYQINAAMLSVRDFFPPKTLKSQLISITIKIRNTRHTFHLNAKAVC